MKNSRSKEKQIIRILDFVSSYQSKEGKGPREMEIERGLNYRQIHTYLTSLVNIGILEKHREGKAVRYEINK